MKKILATLAAIVVSIPAMMAASPTEAQACAGLIGSNGAVNLGRTTTHAGYHDGVEHYVTAFKFLGGGGQFGTLIPLPDVPTKVERGGAWTLQRLEREASIQELSARAASGSSASLDKAEVLLTAKIDALDLTVLRGGGPSVAKWAQDHGFRLSPDAPEVLEFYAERSPIFLAAVFDSEAAAARGQKIGDGTPVHLTIPTANPWVPLRILGLGKTGTDRIEASVYLLTDKEPAILPGNRPSLFNFHSEKATTSLLDDLRSDDGMGWVPKSAWLMAFRVQGSASDITYDLAVDADGKDEPSAVAAGLASPAESGLSTNEARVAVGIGAGVLALMIGMVVVWRRRPMGGAA